MKTRITSGKYRLFLSLLIVTPIAAVSASGFAGADLNGDGSIDHEEFRTHMVNTFYRADSNRDGMLAGAELNILNPDRMPGADGNGNGRLGLKEFLNSTSADFRSADKNRDHVLDADEIEKANQ